MMKEGGQPKILLRKLILFLCKTLVKEKVERREKRRYLNEGTILLFSSKRSGKMFVFWVGFFMKGLVLLSFIIDAFLRCFWVTSIVDGSVME